MKRNQAKFYFLLALEELEEPVHPDLVQVWLESEYNLDFSMNAVKVNLSRYHSQVYAKDEEADTL